MKINATIVLLCTCLCMSFSSYSQTTFIKEIVGEAPISIYELPQTSDGGYIARGSYADSVSINQALIVKLNSTLDVEWMNRRSDTIFNSMTTYAVKEGIHGNYYLLSTVIGQPSKMLLTSFDQKGQVQWWKDYGNTMPFGTFCNLFVDSIGNTTIFGSIPENNPNDLLKNNIWILQVDSLGNEIWQKQIATNGIQDINGVSQLSNGNFLLNGSFNLDSDTNFLMEMNYNGDPVWFKKFSVPYHRPFYGESIMLNDGSIIH